MLKSSPFLPPFLLQFLDHWRDTSPRRDSESINIPQEQTGPISCIHGFVLTAFVYYQICTAGVPRRTSGLDKKFDVDASTSLPASGQPRPPVRSHFGARANHKRAPSLLMDRTTLDAAR